MVMNRKIFFVATIILVTGLFFVIYFSVSNQTRIEKYEFVHEFVDKEGKIIGTMYGEKVAENIYSSFYIIDEQGSYLYEAMGGILKNLNGVEADFSGSEYLGMEVLLFKDDYVVLMGKDANGNVSDNFNLVWNPEESFFEIPVTP